ncbi:hypothetical protein AVEN_21240-1 [Araneus ventricosus]|uniref:Uncharacterized protein n=1 Tax=Araneus ventricosus TaxID=182803 RepID=A0A4Y2GJT5_ARAVE|nr:hypothetical protein AVEN_21240-1 [Araneus ventricosus]
MKKSTGRKNSILHETQLFSISRDLKIAGPYLITISHIAGPEKDLIVSTLQSLMVFCPNPGGRGRMSLGRQSTKIPKLVFFLNQGDLKRGDSSTSRGRMFWTTAVPSLCKLLISKKVHLSHPSKAFGKFMTKSSDKPLGRHQQSAWRQLNSVRPALYSGNWTPVRETRKWCLLFPQVRVKVIRVRKPTG